MLSIGDPNDNSLRKVEKNVLINNLIKDRANQEACKEYVQSNYRVGFLRNILTFEFFHSRNLLNNMMNIFYLIFGAICVCLRLINIFYS